jgi:tyrosyl-tRNA synthetase
MGGSDQWGNITAGMDLIRRVRGERTYGLVMPLLTTAAGAKFGKSESGTVWLDAGLTTPYEFYQFWVNTDDRDAVSHLKRFTFLDAGRIAAIEAAHARAPGTRDAQRALAREVTRLVHGDAAVREAETAADKLFSGRLSAMSVAELLQVFPSVPSATVTFRHDGWRLTALLKDAGVTASTSEAARLIRGGGIYVNERRITDETHQLMQDQAIEGQIFVVRRGKRDHFLVRIARG